MPDSRRRRSWIKRLRSGARVKIIALLVFPAGVACFLAYSLHLGVTAVLGSLPLSGGTLASIYLAWLAIPKGEGTAAPAGADADEVAKIVLEQWNQRMATTSKDLTAYLPVPWQAADPSLGVSWEKLVEVARSRSPVSARQHGWAPGPAGLAGSGTELPEVLQKIPTGWLVVLGGAGYGKSFLMIALVKQLLLARRESGNGGPVPVLVPVKSWDPEKDDLFQWLTARLPVEYPVLDAYFSEDRDSRLGALLDGGKVIMPVLDGLDEMPPMLRQKAIRRLNAAIGDANSPLRLVITCRTEDYSEAVKGRHRLTGAAVIELCQPEPGPVAQYLMDHDDPARWASVVEALNDPATPAAQALRTPLYAGLAFAIYNSPGPGREPPDPGELCSREKFPTRKAVEDYLLGKFIPAIYDVDERAAQEPGPDERRLMFLARYLTEDRDHATSLRWWDLDGIAPRALVPAIAGSVCGIAAAVTAGTGTHVGPGIGLGFGVGMMIALAVGVGSRYARNPGWHKELGKVRRPGVGAAGGLIGAVIGAVAAGVAGKYGVGHETSIFSGLPEALGIGIGAGAVSTFAGGLTGCLLGQFVAGCLAATGIGLPAGLVDGLGVALVTALAVHYLGRGDPAQRRPSWEPLIGLAGGLVIGLAIGLVTWREEGGIAGAVAGVVIGAASSVPFGLRYTAENLDYAVSPVKVLRADASAFRLTAWAAGLAAGCAGAIGGSLTAILAVDGRPGLAVVLQDGLGIGLSSGLAIGLAFGFYHAASPGFRIINWWLAVRGKAPWRLQHFLEDACEKGAMRQAGASYQFRHLSLQEYLASRETARTGEGHGGGDQAGAAWARWPGPASALASSQLPPIARAASSRLSVTTAPPGRRGCGLLGLPARRQVSGMYRVVASRP
jgi:hypothetical protein